MQTKQTDEKIILKIINIAIVVISYLATYFMPYIINFKEEITLSNSINGIALFCGFIVLLKKSFIKENISKIKNVCTLGTIFSVFLVLGNQIKTNGEIKFKDVGLYLAIIVFSVIIDAILVQIYKIIEKLETREEKEEKQILTGKKRYIAIFLVILLCWIPVFLAAYPGYFCYDVGNEVSLYQINYVIKWQTVIHTLIIGFAITFLENLTGNINTAIAIYTIVQMIIISAVFTYSIYFLEKYKVSKIIRIISIIYYAIFPVSVMFAMCACKDTIFTALVLLSIIATIEALLDKEKFIKSKWLQIRFIIVTFFAIILRNNAIYAYIPFLIIFMIVFKRKQIIIPVISVGILYLIYIGPFYYIVGVPGRYEMKTEAYSVPLQQIARVYNYNYESLDKEELEEIYKYTTDKQLKNYVPKLSDPVKTLVVFDKIGKLNFFKLWFNIGIKNPRNLYRVIFRKYISILASRFSSRWI